MAQNNISHQIKEIHLTTLNFVGRTVPRLAQIHNTLRLTDHHEHRHELFSQSFDR
jgi:hypothetical protein